MADFTIDVSRSKTSRINLGIQGENIIEHIIFNISAWIEEFGEGDAYVYAQRKGDENPYPVALDMDLDAGTATWTLNATDTAVKGKGKAQLVYVVDEDGTEAITDDEIKKTRVFSTTVQTSLIPASEENPDAYETWLEVLGGYTARIEAAEDDIKTWVTAQINAIDFPVDDVQIDGTSVVSDGVAEIPKAAQNQFGVVKVMATGDAPGGYAEITYGDSDTSVRLPYVVESNGVVTRTIREKYLPEATTTEKGAMSSTDKEKLDGIESGAEVNVQADWGQRDSTEDDYIKNKPGNATAYTDGFLSAANKRKLDSIEYSADVTPGVATTTSMGLMSSSDKSKLNGIEAGAQVNPVEFEGTDGTTDGEAGLVPAPETTDAGKYLKADGSWGMPANATTSTDGLMPASDKLKTELLGIEEHGAGELSDAGIGIYVYKSEKSRELRGYKENLNANVDRNIWFSDAGRDNSYDNISTNVQMKTPVIYNNDITSKMPVGKFLVKASCTPGNWGWVGIYKGHKEVSDTFGKAEVYCYLDSWPASGGDRRSGGHGSLQNVEFDLLSIYDGYADVHGVYWFFPPGEYTVAVFEADNYTSCIDVCHFAVLDTAWRAWAYDDDFTYNSATKTLKVENIESANVVEDVAILNTYGQRTSIVNDGVAEIPTASENTKGVVSVGIAANREMGHLKVNGYSVPYFIENSDGSMDTYVNSKFLPNAGPNTSGIISPSDKMKLDGIEDGAEANVQSDWNQSDNTADDFIKNKPAIVQKPSYKQTFTAGGTYNLAYIDIPYVESYSAEDLLNAKIYYFSANRVCEADSFYISKYNKNGVDVWRYTVYFDMSCESGSTVVFENMFTDTDAEYTGVTYM